MDCDRRYLFDNTLYYRQPRIFRGSKSLLQSFHQGVRLSYPQPVHERAFVLWSLKRSMQRVLEQIRFEFPGLTDLTRKTLYKWKIEEKWDERRQEKLGEIRESSDREVAENLRSMSEDVYELIQGVIGDLHDLRPRFFGEAANVLPSWISLYKKLEGIDGKGGMSVRKMAESIKTAMMRVPALAEVLKNESVMQQLAAEIEVALAE